MSRGQVVRDMQGRVRGDKGQDNPLVEGCPLSAVVIDGEEYEIRFSASLYRQGLCPGLSAYVAESPLAEAIRRATDQLRAGRRAAAFGQPDPRRERW